MPVRSVGKWLVLGTLAATLGVGGCKEDDGDDTNTDAGGTTDAGGGTDAGPVDSGAPKDSGGGGDAAAEAGVSCGSPAMACTGHMTGLGPVAAGCAKNYQDAEVCGLSTMSLLNGAEPKFIEKNAPGVASQSCADFFDRQEPVPDGGVPDGGQSTMGNGFINTTLMPAGLPITILLQYPGCCTKKGTCSGQGMLGKASTNGGAAWNDSDNGYGCMQSELFFRSLPAAAQAVPCDPTTGMILVPSGDAGSDAGPSDAGADGGNG